MQKFFRILSLIAVVSGIFIGFSSKPATAAETQTDYFIFLPMVINGTKTDFINGDFEQGDDVGWSIATKGYISEIIVMDDEYLQTPIANSGSWLAWLGGITLEDGYLAQNIYISPSKPYLHYWYQVIGDVGCSSDIFNIKINDSIVKRSVPLCNVSITEWQKGSLSLAEFTGQVVNIKFAIVTGDVSESSIFLDDISMQSTP